jgi:uncharacterized protein (DUF2235 family)
VICCNGTGNEFSDRNSNVVKLYSPLIIDGETQVGHYHPGVGTMGAPAARTRLGRIWSVLTGLALGAGLLDNVGAGHEQCVVQPSQSTGETGAQIPFTLPRLLSSGM